MEELRTNVPAACPACGWPWGGSTNCDEVWVAPMPVPGVFDDSGYWDMPRLDTAFPRVEFSCGVCGYRIGTRRGVV